MDKKEILSWLLSSDLY